MTTSAGDEREQTDPYRAVPRDPLERRRLAQAASDELRGAPRSRPLSRSGLKDLGTRVLSITGLSGRYLGYAMVVADNAFWRDQFAAVPFESRLLLLPRCARHPVRCLASHTESGPTCAGCGACPFSELSMDARARGYRVVVAEGTGPVVDEVLGGNVDAVLGVACLESLDRAFERVGELGVPHVSVPLIGSGCRDTELDVEMVREAIGLAVDRPGERTRAWVPLLKAGRSLLEPDRLERLLEVVSPGRAPALSSCLARTRAISVDWLGAGGKRFRPFITLAAYAACAADGEVTRPGARLEQAFSDPVCRVALAIEVLHKASLVHDDIEDGDATRYGADTVHRVHGIPAAINAGDFLIGLGYKLVTLGGRDLGAACVADLVEILSSSHVSLARGQGAELALRGESPAGWKPDLMQVIYALKTAPAFEAAFLTGLRMAGPIEPFVEALRTYSRCLGIAYQVRNDLAEVDGSSRPRTVDGAAREPRPTLLRAFAEARGGPALARLRRIEACDLPAAERLAAVREIYGEAGVLDRAERLVDTCRDECLRLAGTTGPELLRALMEFVARAVV